MFEFAAVGGRPELIVVSVLLVAIGLVSEIQLLRSTLPWLGAGCFVLAIGSWAVVTRPRAR